MCFRFRCRNLFTDRAVELFDAGTYFVERRRVLNQFFPCGFDFRRLRFVRSTKNSFERVDFRTDRRFTAAAGGTAYQTDKKPSHNQILSDFFASSSVNSRGFTLGMSETPINTAHRAVSI